MKHEFEVDRYGWVIARGEDKGMLKSQSVEALLLHAILMELRKERLTKPDSASVFCWLVELLEPEGNSMGYYHTGRTDIGGQSISTKLPHDACQYGTRDEAERVAARLHHLAGVWKAVEHGFSIP